ncbi:MAG: DUF6291 domain-containing protein [Treponema sp.]|nr:DUF6291 domain-containing protein [Treponema sp.]
MEHEEAQREADNKFEIISLTFFKDWHELAKKHKLTKEQYGAVVFAMFEYSFYDIETELVPPEGIIFDMTKPYIKSSNKKKLEGYKGGNKARGKSGAPEGNDNANKKRIADGHVASYKEKTFLYIWENLGDPFSAHYKIWDRQYWNDFWDSCPYTQKEIYLALRNIHYAVNKGWYERKYISADPCKFIQGSMIQRGLGDDDAGDSYSDLWDNYHDQPDPNLEKLRDD